MHSSDCFGLTSLQSCLLCSSWPSFHGKRPSKNKETTRLQKAAEEISRRKNATSEVAEGQEVRQEELERSKSKGGSEIAEGVKEEGYRRTGNQEVSGDGKRGVNACIACMGATTACLYRPDLTLRRGSGTSTKISTAEIFTSETFLYQ